MSSSKPANREEFKSFCLRKLGEPAIRVDVVPIQVEDCVDQAIEYFQRMHFDGSQKMIIPYIVTEEDVINGYFKIDDSILGINRVLEVSGSFSSASGNNIMLTPQWQMFASAAQSLTGCIGCGMCNGGMMQYVGFLQNMDMLKWLMGGKHIIMEFSRHTDRLYIYGEDSKIKAGACIAVECTRVLNPDEFPQVWNDPFLKKYATALIKQQWGNNLRKHRNVVLSGGLTLQAEEILVEANDEIAALEESMHSEHMEPAMPRFG